MSSYSVVLSAIAILIIIVDFTSCANVTTQDGIVEGTTMQSRRGVTFDAFYRIPFAKPPIGELRFKDPLPNEPWNEPLDGTAYGPACSQVAGLIPAADISEDCLHLNVFTKSLSGSELKPVIVFIHGGGFEYGSAIISTPIVLMDRDIVFVTINYRMGPFGFLATGTAQTPGNAGIKDMVMALDWIKRNIAVFGGDDNRITVWGMSAGSFSITALMASPLSHGLFHRVIGMSGAITSPTNLKYDSMDNVRKLAAGLNCVNDNPDEIVTCLRNKTQNELLSISMRDLDASCPKFPWWPVVEPDFGQKRVLEDQPTRLFENGDFLHVPTLIGSNRDEFASLVPDLFKNASFLPELNERFDELAPGCFLFDGATVNPQPIRKGYFPYDVIDARSFEDLNYLFSDSIIGYPTHLFVKSASKSIDVYYYRFSYVSSISLFNYPRNAPYSVVHGDDTHYLIPWFFFPTIGVDNVDNFIVERLLSIYENFARNGNPNNSTDVNLTTMRWPTYNNSDAYYLDIYRHLVEKQGLYEERFEHWSKGENRSAPNSATVSN